MSTADRDFCSSICIGCEPFVPGKACGGQGTTDACTSRCAPYVMCAPDFGRSCFPKPPSPPPAPVTARKDPHLYLPHGGRADFRGAHDTVFCLLSAQNVSFNVKIEESDFHWSKRLVHGTKMSAAYWVVRTNAGRVLRVEYNATSKEGGVVHEEDHRAVRIRESQPPLLIDNTHIELVAKKLSVTIAGKWRLSAARAAFPFGNLPKNRNKQLLDIQVEALYDADHDKVAPHGIFGQGYDGDALGVNGKLDDDKSVESTTSAQAEGAIEGVWVDYKLASPFSTDFKYSRFDALSAKPRDVKKLSGELTVAPALSEHGVVGATDLPAIA